MLNRLQHSIVICVLSALTFPSTAWTRSWQDTSGKYAVVGDLIAHNAEQVVIKRENGKLLSITISELSDADREYLKSKESSDSLKSQADRIQIWHFHGGYQAHGRVVEYGQKDITIARKRGRVYINDRPIENLSEPQQAIIRSIVAHESQVTIANNRELEKWLAVRDYKPQSFHLEGVIMVLENGDEVGIPFFLFSETDREMLKPGWQRWLKANADQKARQQESFMLEAQSRAYDMQKQQTQAAQASLQVAQLQLGMLAVATGAVELWEVELYPPDGSYAYPLIVVVPGRNSEIANQLAMQKFPGYVAGSSRRVTRF